MARNGSGTYSLPAGNPVVTGTTIQSTWANTTLSDIATALTQSLSQDGQTPVTANLPMGGFKLTGLAAGTTAGDSIRYEQFASPPAIGGTVAAAGSFTTLSASSTVSGTGFSTYLASPPAIGGTAASTGRFTTCTATTQFSGPGTGLTGTAASLSIGGNAATATTATSISGTVAIANGGTGQTTASAAVAALAPIQVSAAATLSGTSTDITGIPANVSRVELMINGLSTSGTSYIKILMGTGSGFESSGYLGGCQTTGIATPNFSTEIQIAKAAGNVFYVKVTLLKSAANVFHISIVGALSSSGSAILGGGYKSLAAALTQLRITTLGGTDTFTAGTATITWEF